MNDNFFYQNTKYIINNVLIKSYTNKTSQHTTLYFLFPIIIIVQEKHYPNIIIILTFQCNINYIFFSYIPYILMMD